MLGFGKKPIVASQRILNGNRAVRARQNRRVYPSTRHLSMAERLSVIQSRMRKHCAEHKPRWAAREALRLTAQRGEKGLAMLWPRGASRRTGFEQAVAKQASQIGRAHV